MWSDRFDLSGTTTFRAASEDVERPIVGEVRVRAPVVGGMIERLLAQQWIDDGW